MITGILNTLALKNNSTFKEKMKPKIFKHITLITLNNTSLDTLKVAPRGELISDNLYYVN